jgi:hypothetical protein
VHAQLLVHFYAAHVVRERGDNGSLRRVCVLHLAEPLHIFTKALTRVMC